MGQAVEPKAANFSIRMTRTMMSVVFGATRLVRRPPTAPCAIIEHAYGPDPAEQLEVIEPRTGAPRRAAIVYIHGGGWIAGRKEMYTRYLSFLAEAGHPVFNVEYPLAPENPHPGILCSLLRALDWIQANRPDVTGFHLMGDSAGGNLAMMLGLFATNPNLLGAIDPDRTSGVAIPCHSVVSLYGVLDRLSWIEEGFPGAASMLESYAGRAAFEEKVGPELAITPSDLEFAAAPATLLAVGTRDPLLRSSRLFADRLNARSARCVQREYPGEGHGFFNLGLSKSAPQLRADILDFLAAEDPSSA